MLLGVGAEFVWEGCTVQHAGEELGRGWGEVLQEAEELFQPWRSYLPPGGQHSQIFAEIDVFNMQKHSEGKIFCMSSASKISVIYLQNSSILSVLIQQEVYFWAG